MDEIKEAFIEESGELFENISAVLIKAEENGTLSNGEIKALIR